MPRARATAATKAAPKRAPKKVAKKAIKKAAKAKKPALNFAMQTHETQISQYAVATRKCAENAQLKAVDEEFNPVDILLQAASIYEYTAETYMLKHARDYWDEWRI